MSTLELNNLSHSGHAGHSASSRLTELTSHAATRLVAAIRTRLRQRRDRAAFMTLVGKEEWIYRDLGVSRGDVQWASRLPMHINAAEELEKIRAHSRMGR